MPLRKDCGRPAPTACWRDWTILQFSDFFRMRLMAHGAGLWLDADVLLLKPVEIDPARPYFAWERPRQLGNSVLYLPPNDPIVAAFAALMQQDELTPDWLSLRPSPDLRAAQAARRIEPPLRHPHRDLWSGGADRARAPRRRIALRAAEEIVLCGACRPEALLRAFGFFRPDRRSRDHRAPRLAERAAATSRPLPAAFMPGPRSGSGPNEIRRIGLSPCDTHHL